MHADAAFWTRLSLVNKDRKAQPVSKSFFTTLRQAKGPSSFLNVHQNLSLEFGFNSFRFGHVPQKMYPLMQAPVSDEPLQISSSPFMDVGFLNHIPPQHGPVLSGSLRSRINGM